MASPDESQQKFLKNPARKGVGVLTKQPRLVKMDEYQKRACSELGCSDEKPYTGGIPIPADDQSYADYLKYFSKEILIRWLCAAQLELEEIKNQP